MRSVFASTKSLSAKSRGSRDMLEQSCHLRRPDDAYGRCRILFVVLCQSTAPAEVGKGPFNNPAARQDLEGMRSLRSFDDLPRDHERVPNPLPCFGTRVPLICPDAFQAGKTTDDRSEEVAGSNPVIDIGSMTAGCQEVAHRINEDVTLAAGDLLSPHQTRAPRPLPWSWCSGCR